jgi:hypothetical protein
MQGFKKFKFLVIFKLSQISGCYNLKSRVEIIWHLFNMWEIGGLLEAP